MQHVHYTDKPQPVAVEYGYGVTALNYTVAINIEQTETGWDADVHRFWEEPEVLSVDEIKAAPEKYISYVPVKDRDRIQREYTDAVQRWMDTTAHTRGYDDIFTAISYAGSSVPKFQKEGIACREWRDKVWVACYDYLDKVLAGDEELVPVEELISRLPQLEW